MTNDETDDKMSERGKETLTFAGNVKGPHFKTALFFLQLKFAKVSRDTIM